MKIVLLDISDVNLNLLIE